MGSFIEINDTLQITEAQGFPKELDLDVHKNVPLHSKAFQDHIFSFENKPDIRVFHSPPCRCFLAKNTGDDWIYWGHIHMLSIHHDYQNRTTSGTFKITKIFTIDEMNAARDILGVKQKEQK